MEPRADDEAHCEHDQAAETVQPEVIAGDDDAEHQRHHHATQLNPPFIAGRAAIRQRMRRILQRFIQRHHQQVEIRPQLAEPLGKTVTPPAPQRASCG